MTIRTKRFITGKRFHDKYPEITKACVDAQDRASAANKLSKWLKIKVKPSEVKVSTSWRDLVYTEPFREARIKFERA